MKVVCGYLVMVLIFISACNSDGKKNTPPIANAGEDRVISVEQLIELDGSQSSDPDGDQLAYEWTLATQPDGREPVFADTDSAHPIFIAYEKGDYWFQLRVFDGREWSESDSVQITAEADAFEPEAMITVVPESPRYGEMVYVSGEASTDPNNDPLNFYWKAVSTPDPININPYMRSFSFVPERGKDNIYTFALRVDDSRFTSDYAFQDIQIANTPPSVYAGNDAKLLGSSPPYYYYLNFSGIDLDRDALTYEWQILRAVAGSNPQIDNPPNWSTRFTTDIQGFYVLRLRAYDGEEWSVPDYITLCNGPDCDNFLNSSVSINPEQVNLHPFYNSSTGKYTANLLTSNLVHIQGGLQDATKRWVLLLCPTGVQMTVLDPNVPDSTTLTFEGGINMVNSSCVLRFELDNLSYNGNITYIISSSDTNTGLFVNFVNAPPDVSAEDFTFALDSARVFQRVPLSITASDPDGDNLNYYWSVVSKPENAQAFFSSDSNRPDPLLYVGKERDALGEYTLRVIVEDTLGGSNMAEIKLSVEE